MKLIKKIVAASSAVFGATLFTFSVSNLEFSEYTDLPLFDWKILVVAGVIAYIPFVVLSIKGELWQDNL